MNKKYIVAGVLLGVLLPIGYFLLDNNQAGEHTLKNTEAPLPIKTVTTPTSTMKLESIVLQNNASIPKEFTCDGENVSLELEFIDVPVEAKSLVLIMDDPDVPTNIRPDGVFDHWVVYDIDPGTKIIPRGEFEGIQGVNTTGRLGYTGPCPPDREHRYFFKLYALDSMLGLPEGQTKTAIQKAMRGHILAEAELMGRYDRGK